MIGDPQYLAYLRDLPSGYLLDLLTDQQEGAEDAIIRVLKERGYTPEDLKRDISRRRNSRLPRRATLWTMARWASLFNALLIFIFNALGFYRLMHSEDQFKVPLLFLAVFCAGVGFFLGYKLTTHIYQGAPNKLYCGFPVPIGSVELETGRESRVEGSALVIRMAINAMVGVCFTLFPLVFIALMMP